MNQEYFEAFNQGFFTNDPTNYIEEGINMIFSCPFKKMESWNSQTFNDIYFRKKSSSFHENLNFDNKVDEFEERNSFNMENFEDAFESINPQDEVKIEKENVLNEKNEGSSQFLKANICNLNNYTPINDDDYIIKPINPFDILSKGKISIEEIKSNEEETEKFFEKPKETVKPSKKKSKRGPRGPYNKKPKPKIKAKIDDKCFPFTSGSNLLSEKISQYLNNTFFTTNKYMTDSEGNIKKQKKARKFKPDDIRKKIKVRFHKKIKNIINENLKKAGSQELFSFLPQFFIGNIAKKFNNQFMNMTYEELLSVDFSDSQKEYFNKDIDKNQFVKNKKTLDYLEKNVEISRISGFDKVKKMKYRDILRNYFSSDDFENSVIQLETENESVEYIQEYILLSKGYIDYFNDV